MSSASDVAQTDPLVFISHKHSDREIAETIARFIRTKTAGKVRVHLSSSPNFEGPRLGKHLNDELKRALGAAEAVILVFTSETEDWSWCMWECGIATNPNDPHPTSVVVVQCGPDKPKPFADQLSVDARDLDSLQTFVRTLLAGTDLFVHRDAPVTGFAAEGLEVKEFAAELHGKLDEVLPAGVGAERSTPTSPYLRLRLDDETAKQLRTAYLEGDPEKCLPIVGAKAEIAESAGVESVFDMRLDAGATLGDVLTAWRIEHPGNQEAGWFSALAEQVESAIVGTLRPVKWAPFRTTNGRADVPYVAASRRIAGGVEFDVYVVAFAPRPVPVTERMLTLDQMYMKDAAVEPLEQILLMKVVQDMNERRATRLPIVDGGHPHSIVHEATINKFIVKAMQKGRGPDLSLQDLLDDNVEGLAQSYAEVSPEATIDEAMKAMAAKPGCQDVYVTRDGLVVGWLPNVVFIHD
ncbi:MAG TPA: toll/interleukin-1 receptor domain-containing protein [Solirubrobacter sp.]